MRLVNIKLIRHISSWFAKKGWENLRIFEFFKTAQTHSVIYDVLFDKINGSMGDVSAPKHNHTRY